MLFIKVSNQIEKDSLVAKKNYFWNNLWELPPRKLGQT